MKKFKFLAVVIATWVFGLGVYSCQKETKEDKTDLSSTSDLDIESRTNYNCIPLGLCNGPQPGGVVTYHDEWVVVDGNVFM